VNISRIPFSKLEKWKVDPLTGSIHHESGKFFSIEGIHVKTDMGSVKEWKQPIINQPEIGILGFLTKEIGGILHFLIQAKIEPGNVNHVQLSPTLQATKSNYRQIHQGKSPRYLEYFLNAKPEQVILDQVQSEQGARFFKKRNRNIIVHTLDEIPDHPDFRWVTLGQIVELIRLDNTVNMDTRTVISGIIFDNQQSHEFAGLAAEFLHSAIDPEFQKHSDDDILFWLSRLKSTFELQVDRIPLNQVNDWIIDDSEIRHKDGKYFRVIGVEVSIENREVRSWHQPLVEPVQEGLCAFIVKRINGTIHFLVQAKLESGNFDIVELAPTVQCLTGNYRNSPVKPAYLDDVLDADAERIVFDTLQSEEGGRFYHEQNRNRIVMMPDDFSEETPDAYRWMTASQLKMFLKFNNYLNIQARSLLSALPYVGFDN
jgi:oxidase EvaA